MLLHAKVVVVVRERAIEEEKATVVASIQSTFAFRIVSLKTVDTKQYNLILNKTAFNLQQRTKERFCTAERELLKDH